MGPHQTRWLFDTPTRRSFSQHTLCNFYSDNSIGILVFWARYKETSIYQVFLYQLLYVYNCFEKAGNNTIGCLKCGGLIALLNKFTFLFETDISLMFHVYESRL